MVEDVTRSRLGAALVAHRAGRFGNAEAILRRWLEDHPEDFRAWQNLGAALRQQERWDEALEAFRAAADLGPNEPLALTSLGHLNRFLGRLEASEIAYRKALSRDARHAPALAGLGQTLLSQGRSTEGWSACEARRGLGEGTPRDPHGREWMGEEVAGRHILLCAEQGLGDQIMMARLVEPLRQLGAEVSITCAPPLERLFAGAGLNAIPRSPVMVLPALDFGSLLFTAAQRLAIDLSKPPEPLKVRAEPTHTGGIGIMGAGNPAHAFDAYRSLPAHLTEVLLQLPRAIDLSPASTGAADMQDTANIMAGLDLVITVDTSVAHLAGSLGKPTWLLLSALGTDWRWGQQRESSVWYPSMRLFRQRRHGDWGDLVARVVALAT